MTEKQDKNYIDLFEKCAQWLESHSIIRSGVKWLQKHVKLALFVAVALTYALYLWFMAHHQRLSIQQRQIDDLKQQLRAAQNQIKVNRDNCRINHKEYTKQWKIFHRESATLKRQLEVIKQASSMGKLPLMEMEINGQRAYLDMSREFWIKESTLKLSKLKFGIDSSGNSVVSAVNNIHCLYQINKGNRQKAISVEDLLVLPLNTQEQNKFSLLFSKITFTGHDKGQYTGFASFNINVDIWPPELEAQIGESHIELMIIEKGGDGIDDGLELAIVRDDGKLSWKITPTSPAPFSWRKIKDNHYVDLPLNKLGNWKKLHFSVKDLAGNVSKTSLRKLPQPVLRQTSGDVISLPVVLDIEPAPDSLTAHLRLEKFADNQFSFLRETVPGALSLPEGKYRVKAYFTEDGERGPYGKPVEFRVDTTPPGAQLIFEQKQNQLHWQIIPNEEQVKAWTSVEWQGKLQTLNTPGLKGQCELSPKAIEVKIQVKLKDTAGNENILTKNWTCVKSEKDQ